MKLLSINPAARKISGATDEEIFSLPCNKTFCSCKDRPVDCPVQQSISDSKSHSKNIRMKGHDYIATAYPIIIDGVLINVVKTLIDVTDLNKTRIQLERALLDSQNASIAKSSFLATMSHEIRTPLNAVLGFSELLKSTKLSDSERENYVSSINIAGSALLKLINDVLDLSKIESGGMEITPVASDVKKIFEEIVSIFKYKTQSKNIELLLACQDDIPLLKVDTMRLRQILLNLIGNAIKFTSHGHVKVSLEFKKNQDADLGDLVFAIEDTGIGVDESFKDTIFDAFVQQASTRGNSRYEGTGLGLSISKKLVEKMGGEIHLESEVGKGSLFTVSFQNVSCDCLPIQSREISNSIKDLSKCKKILLVDDIRMNLDVLKAMISKKFDMQIQTADSAEEALSMLDAEEFDLLLSDMWMPTMTGADLARKLKSNPKFNKLKVVLVTADTEANSPEIIEDFDAVLMKPISINKLKNMLGSLF